MVIYYSIWCIVLGFIANSITGYVYELNVQNVCGTLGFQLLLTGTAEELMFRALPIVCFKTLCRKISKITDIVILLITSILFTIVHINFTIPIFSQLYSLAYVFINGMIFGIVYLKSNSVIYPMIMHGVGNFISVGGCYLYMVLSHHA
jgi:membrane protease YdiL (CAAX protease family)